METNSVPYKWSIITSLKKHKLPLSVRSSAMKIFDRIANNLEMYKISHDDTTMLAIMIACKCEDVQGGTVDSMLHRLSSSRRVELVHMENIILNSLGFDFYFPSPYTKVYAILVMLQEREILVISNRKEDALSSKRNKNLLFIEGDTIKTNKIDPIWNRAIENIDYILCLDRKNWTEIEIAYAALEFPCDVFKGLPFDFSGESINYLKCNITRVKEIVSSIKR